MPGKSPGGFPDLPRLGESAAGLIVWPMQLNRILPGPMVLVVSGMVAAVSAQTPPRAGMASWYGENHRGKLMANGERFDPGKMTAASWFYPLGTRVRVSLNPSHTVIVTITDRGPARPLVREGRILDLAQAAFAQLASPGHGLVPVTVEQVR